MYVRGAPLFSQVPMHNLGFPRFATLATVVTVGGPHRMGPLGFAMLVKVVTFGASCLLRVPGVPTVAMMGPLNHETLQP